MKEELSLLDSLRGLAMLQQRLANFALCVAGMGPAEFEGELITCTLPSSRKRVSTLLAMAAGQSVETILRFSKLSGIPVRDAYPVARTAIETYINAAYLASESDDVAERAIRYIDYAAWRHFNMRVGNGDCSLEFRSDPDPEKTMAERFTEFSGKGKNVWTTLDLASRIRRVDELAGKQAGSRLLNAYALCYNISSEVIHGSPFGVSYFYNGLRSGEPSVDNFRKESIRHLEEILIAVLHAGCGYLSIFFFLQKMHAPHAAEKKIFDRLYELSTKDSKAFPDHIPDSE